MLQALIGLLVFGSLSLTIPPNTQTEALIAPSLPEPISTSTSGVIGPPEPLFERPATSTDAYCSCMNTARLYIPDLPFLDARDLEPNSEPVIGGAILLEYENNSHIATLKGFLTEGFGVVEGNYESCQKTERTILYNDEHIKGFYIPPKGLVEGE